MRPHRWPLLALAVSPGVVWIPTQSAAMAITGLKFAAANIVFRVTGLVPIWERMARAPASPPHQ